MEKNMYLQMIVILTRIFLTAKAYLICKNSTYTMNSKSPESN